MTTFSLKKDLYARQTAFTGKRVIVAGQVTHDQYKTLQPGGCAYFAAKTLQGLGSDVSLFTSVGHDFQFPHHMRGIQCRLEVGAHTTVFTNVYPAEGPRIQYVTHQSPALDATRLPVDWPRADLMILAPVMGEMEDLSWHTVRNAGHTAVFLQGFLKEAHTAERQGRRLVVPRDTRFDWGILKGVDSVFLSREDIELFASSDFLNRLIASVPIVAVTDGERGSRIYHDHTYVDVDIFPVDAVDPTGAGDTFGATMAMALACGFSVASAGRLGAAAASVTVEGEGGSHLDRIPYAWRRWPLIESHFADSQTLLVG